MSCGTPVNYLCCENTGEHQLKAKKEWEKEKVTLEYTTPHTPKLNGVIERIFSAIKEGALNIILNEKLNDTAQKILWAEAVHTCKRVHNSLDNTGSTKITFGNLNI